MSVIGTNEITLKQYETLTNIMNSKFVSNGISIEDLVIYILNTDVLKKNFENKSVEELKTIINEYIKSNPSVCKKIVNLGSDFNDIDFENAHNDISKNLEQIRIPLNVLDQEIVVNIFRTNFNDLEADKQASGIIDKHPGVYCFFNNDSIYIGESVHPFMRLSQHIQTGNLRNNDEIIIFRSEQFNKSVIYDIETKLIDYLASEQKFYLRNTKTQQGDHVYFLKFAYEPVINKIWNFLIELGLTQKTMKEIESTDMFKFSPYKSLNSDQLNVVESTDEALLENDIVLINGRPGTGKSILASTLYMNLSSSHKVCLTSGTHQTVETFKRVFKLHNKKIKNGSAVLKTSQLLKSGMDFEIVIVDEAHRLSKSNSKGHPGKYAHIVEDELKMITDKFKKVIIFYDDNQYVHDGDFIPTAEHFKKCMPFQLNQQMRASNGDEYILWMVDLLKNNFNKIPEINKYDFKSFDNFKTMYESLLEKSSTTELTRLVSGYTREWISLNDSTKFDFDIDGIKLKWNNIKSVANGKWLQSEAAKKLEEVTYYNVIQGFDLDYAGVIIGKDLFLDENEILCVDEDYVIHTNQKPKKSDPFYKEKLLTWVLNRYKILLSRGAKGTYVYIEDERLRNKIKELIK